MLWSNECSLSDERSTNEPFAMDAFGTKPHRVIFISPIEILCLQASLCFLPTVTLKKKYPMTTLLNKFTNSLSRPLATLSSVPPLLSGQLKIKNGPQFKAKSFGAPVSVSGELVFTTSLVGYTESMTDPSYHGQILCFTQPLIGNYGVPSKILDQFGLYKHFESGKIQVKGIVVNDYATKYSHWNAVQSLAEWCQSENIPAFSHVDTRAIVSFLRDKGTTLAQMTVEDQQDVPVPDYQLTNMVARVSPKEIQVYNAGAPIKIALLNFGAKENIIRCLAKQGCEVTSFPWNTDLVPYMDSFDGVFLSNGPGDPANVTEAVQNVRRVLESEMNKKIPTPIFGICMGHQLLGLAAGFSSYKLPFGNRGHNQPCLDLIKGGCVMTSQNHGYCLDDSKLPEGWIPFFRNANDKSNEGICHATKPFASVQFHPEAMGGPEDTQYLFEDFVRQCHWQKQKKAVRRASGVAKL
ncbi:class I glutamine amidotransferase-like protein [Gorgonomyces haynaldii]|nr:class I glutamine amidotransferase-like protein [Gorgonomyces haynaldii]